MSTTDHTSDVLNSAENPGAECPSSSRPFVLAATILGSSLAFINASAINVALPAMQSGLDATASDLQWIVNGYSLMLAALILVGGSVGDHYGLKKIFGWGILLFSVGSLWCGLAPGTTQLVVARILQGIGGAMAVPNSLAIIARSYPKEERGRAIGTWAGVSALAAAAGPLLGGWLVDSLSWRWVFFIVIPVAVAAIFLTMRWMPTLGPQGERTKLDLPGAVLATSGLGGLTWGLIEGADRGWTDPFVVIGLVSGLLALILFIRVEARSPSPMMPLSLFRSTTFSGANILTFLLYFSLGGVLFLLPFNLIEVQGYSATEAGAALLPFTLLLGGLSRWSGGLVETFGAKLPLVVGPIITGVGFLALSFPGVESEYFTGFFPGVLLIGVGMTISVAPLTTVVMSTADDELSGVASGINNAATRVAWLLAVAVLGGVALVISSDLLADELALMNIPARVASEVVSSNDRLAQAVLPEGISSETAAAITDAVHRSFVGSFRITMLIAGILGLLSGLVGWVMIEGKSVGEKSSDSR